MELDEAGLFESEYALSRVFDFDYPAKLKKKFIILSSPRTASAKLSSNLYDSGLAGAPFEYFHKNLLKYRNSPEKRPNELNAYLEEMIARRTSPNGYFGMKMHFGQFEYLFGRNPTTMAIGVQLLSEFDKRILISRRDKVSQAIAQLMGRETNAWARPENVGGNGLVRAFTPEDVVDISSFLQTLIFWEHSWRKILASMAGDFIEVAYEDLCEAPEKELGQIFEYLEIGEFRGGPVSFRTGKQPITEVRAEMKLNFLEAIGALNGEIAQKVVLEQGKPLVPPR